MVLTRTQWEEIHSCVKSMEISCNNSLNEQIKSYGIGITVQIKIIKTELDKK